MDAALFRHLPVQGACRSRRASTVATGLHCTQQAGSNSGSLWLLNATIFGSLRSRLRASGHLFTIYNSTIHTTFFLCEVQLQIMSTALSLISYFVIHGSTRLLTCMQAIGATVTLCTSNCLRPTDGQSQGLSLLYLLSILRRYARRSNKFMPSYYSYGTLRISGNLAPLSHCLMLLCSIIPMQFGRII